MTLYEFKLAVCQMAYDIGTNKTWRTFDDYVLRYGSNLTCDAMLFDDFYNGTKISIDKPKCYDAMDMLFQRMKRPNVVEFMRQVQGSREYHTLLDNMVAHTVVGL